MADLFDKAREEANRLVDALDPPLIGSQHQYMVNMLMIMWCRGRDQGARDKMPTIGGIKIVVTEAVAPGVIEFHHDDGRIDRLQAATG